MSNLEDVIGDLQAQIAMLENRIDELASAEYNQFSLVNVGSPGTPATGVGDLYAAGDIKADDDLIAGDDIYTTEWAEYSDTSSITGWASYTTKEIWYKKVGDLVFVVFRIEGTSDDTVTNFTLPHSNISGVRVNGVFRGWDSGGAAQIMNMRLNASDNTITFYAGMGSAVWTNSGTKAIMGQLFYETG